jgi:flagellar hook-associated protein 3 FlgL
MRISTSQIFQTGSRYLMEGQSKLFKIQNQLSTSKKFLSAQDDPVAAAQTLLTSQLLGVNTQYADNQGNASSQLALEEDRLKSVVESVQYIMEQTVAAGNATYSDSQREFYAKDLESQLEFLLGMANSKDANGYYLFSGYQGNTQPFQRTTGGVVYAGDDGQRLMQVGASRQIAVSDSGRDIFERNRTGNGTFALGPDPSSHAGTGNQGTGVIGGGSVNNIVNWTGNKYVIEFTFASPIEDYTITNTTTGVVSPGIYTSGTEISFDGISFSISGDPAVGDMFTVEPSKDQSIFTTLQNLIGAFSTDIQNNAVDAARVQNIVTAEMNNLQRILENVSTVQASIGSRRSELAALTDVSSALDLHYQERLSNLRDLDYAEAISAYMQMQMQLEAAQASFAQTSRLTLFNYL